MKNKTVSEKPSDSAPMYYMLGMAIGYAAGIALGIAMDSLPIGIAIGAGMGVSLGVAFQESKRQGKPEQVRPSAPIIIAVLVGLLIFVGLVGTMLFFAFFR